MLGSRREWPRLYAFNNMNDVLTRGGARISNPDRIQAGDTIYLPLMGPPRPARRHTCRGVPDSGPDAAGGTYVGAICDGL